MVTASFTRMHHVLIILASTFIQGHTDLNHESNKCSIIFQIIQAMPVMFAVKIVWLKVYTFNDVYQSFLNPMTLLFTQGYNCISKLHKFLICTIVVIFRTIFKLWHLNLALTMTVALCMLWILILVTLTMMKGHSGSADDKIQHWIILTTKQVIETLNFHKGRPFFLHYLDFENIYKLIQKLPKAYGLTILFLFPFQSSTDYLTLFSLKIPTLW